MSLYCCGSCPARSVRYQTRACDAIKLMPIQWPENFSELVPEKTFLNQAVCFCFGALESSVRDHLRMARVSEWSREIFGQVEMNLKEKGLNRSNRRGSGLRTPA
jgi:hypothetical protein